MGFNHGENRRGSARIVHGYEKDIILTSSRMSDYRKIGRISSKRGLTFLPQFRLGTLPAYEALVLIALIHSDEGLTLETSVFESFTVANLPYRPCG